MDMNTKDYMEQTIEVLAGIEELLQSLIETSKDTVPTMALHTISNELNSEAQDIKSFMDTTLSTQIKYSAVSIDVEAKDILEDVRSCLEGYATIVYNLDNDVNSIAPALRILTKRITSMTLTLQRIAYPID